MPTDPGQLPAEPLPTHVARDPHGAWHALDYDTAEERRARDGWTVVRVIDARCSKHPIQFRILEHLEHVPEASAQQLANTFGMLTPNVTYHLKVLAAEELVTLTRVSRGGGGIARFFGLPGSRPPLHPGCEELWCQAGHFWQRTPAPGRKPPRCPQHPASA